MAVPNLYPKHFFGLRPVVNGCAQYVVDDEVLYPAGSVLSLHNYSQNKQRFICLPDQGKKVSMIRINSDRTLAAVVEKGDRPCISVYDLTTLKRRKLLLPPPEMVAKEFVAVNFSFDTKYLIAILGPPDWMLLCYLWEKGRVESSTLAINPDRTGTLLEAVCNPNDSSVVAVVGIGLFRLLNVTDRIWRQYGFQKDWYVPMTSAYWITFDRLLCGTKDGRIILFESGDLKSIFMALEFTFMDAKVKEEIDDPVIPPDATEEYFLNTEVHAIASSSEGFAFSCGIGTIHYFAKVSGHTYLKTHVFVIPESDLSDYSYIQNMSMNSNGTEMIATTKSCQIYTITISNDNTESESIETELKYLGEQLHQGAINGLSVCKWKPIFMTCSKSDRTVRVWNYLTAELEMIKQYQEDLFSVALHPTGLFCAVGFSHKLRLMVVYINDLRTVKEFPIRNCRDCCFSTNGHLLAAVNGNIIQLYSMITLTNVNNLKGHNGKIRSIDWNYYDLKLVSCGTEGAVYEWHIPTEKRVGEIIVKSCVFLGVTVTSDGSTSYAVGTDGRVREIISSVNQNDLDVSCEQLDCVALSHNDSMLFVSSACGSVFSMPTPLNSRVIPREYNIHSSAVNNMCVTEDDQYLITCSEDGTLCLWKIQSPDGPVERKDKHFSYFENILEDEEQLEKLTHSISEQNLRIREIETENDYLVRQNEMKYADHIKNVDEAYAKILEMAEKEIEDLEVAQAQEITSLSDDIIQRKSAHEEEIQGIETSYEAKLMEEYDKYQLLEDKTEKIRDGFEIEIAELLESTEKALSEIIQKYENKLHEKKVLLQDLENEILQQEKEHESMKLQIEDDADVEILHLKSKYELMLKAEEDTSTRLRSEAGVMTNAIKSSRKDVEEYKHQIHSMENDKKMFEEMIVSLKKDITDLKTEIGERDNTLEDKEKQIYLLTRDNQELEKYKYVLTHKIEELIHQIEPKNNEIKQQKLEISEMEIVLENLQQEINLVELQIEEIKEKLHVKDHELRSEDIYNKEGNKLLNNIRTELHNASGLLQQPKELRDALKGLYHKYGQDQEFLTVHEQDIDAQMEFFRQRKFLEQTVESLKGVYKSSIMKQGNVKKATEENRKLIVEISTMRKDLKEALIVKSGLEVILGIAGKFILPQKAKARLQMCIFSNEEIHIEFQQRVQEKKELVAQLQEDVQMLISQLPNPQQEEFTKQQQLKTNKLRFVKDPSQ